MEDQCSPLSWPYNYFLEEGIEELKHSLVYTTLELENTVISAHEELARKDEEILHLKDLLTRVVKERDEAQGKCQRLGMEKILLQQQLLQQQQQQVQFQFQFQKQQNLVIESAPISSGTTSHDQENDQILKGVVDSNNNNNNIGLSNSSDCDENNVVVSPPLVQDLMEKIVLKKPLPEKGKFLQAVMEAGPLLQTLLLAGPLPQWQHPPPQLNSIDIPPVTITSPTPRLLHQDSALSSTGAACASAGACFGKKRDVGADTSPQAISKYQKVVHQSSLTNM
ncbi:uncharacterized protein [Nicotiana sylvestris]|uniref:Probable basic-leucine zipper transcription factor R n=1 Tax=Nicotiana sylvestris TaxID=4096 RepID=A0A1U7Y159_NICSY|nr:PREDICTED: probable basic-leucine zipper transcription factor R [Nicotiana sylvestris]